MGFKIYCHKMFYIHYLYYQNIFLCNQWIVPSYLFLFSLIYYSRDHYLPIYLKNLVHF